MIKRKVKHVVIELQLGSLKKGNSNCRRQAILVVVHQMRDERSHSLFYTYNFEDTMSIWPHFMKKL